MVRVHTLTGKDLQDLNNLDEFMRKDPQDLHGVVNV